MGFGFNRMNKVVVQQTTQGLCTYLQKEASADLAEHGVIIGEAARRAAACSLDKQCDW